jgi:hypothetical protein
MGGDRIMSSDHQNGNVNGNETHAERAETRMEQALRASELRHRVLNAELEQRVVERTAELEAFS